MQRETEGVTPQSLNFDDGISETPSGLYRSRGEVEWVQGFDGVTEADIARFHEQGYLVVHDGFNAREVQDALDGLLDLIDGKRPEYRGVVYEAGARALLATTPPEQRQDLVRKLWQIVDYDQRLRAIAEHPAFLAIIWRIMGGEAPELYEDQALLKPPRIGREKPWHQDSAYFNLPPESLVVSVWIALDEAVPENGCMYVIGGSHRQGPVVHFKRRDWQICDTDVAVDDAMIVPLKPGGVLFFHGLLHHGTPPTRSARRRRALQLHYKPASVPRVKPEERMAIFGSEGKDVTC